MKSSNKGTTWTAMQNDLPERGTVYSVQKMHCRGGPLVCWNRIWLLCKCEWRNELGGIECRPSDHRSARHGFQEKRKRPCVRDLWTWLLHPGRLHTIEEVTKETMDGDASLPMKRTLTYIESNPLGLKGTAGQGASLCGSQSCLRSNVHLLH